MNTILEIKNLSKYYGKVLGVKDVSFSLKEKEVFGFIGPNGAGKSTTIRSILNLINKSEGTVYFEGKPLEKEDIESKKRIGYLPSEVAFYEDLTVKEMLDYHESFYAKDIHKRRVELVERLQLEEGKNVEDLSLGNAKKLGIILAFMHEPKLLILDEPTSGLDPIMQQVFYDLLEEEKQKGTTIFYSTHILSEISKICDRVGIIKEGKLLKIESVEEIRSKNLSYVSITSKDSEKIKKELNITVESEKGDTITFKNTIEINTLIKVLSAYQIENLWIEPATLEDVFLHYYK